MIEIINSSDKCLLKWQLKREAESFLKAFCTIDVFMQNLFHFYDQELHLIYVPNLWLDAAFSQPGSWT